MKHFALAGNPNCGKTTLFNSLTGSTAYVGNWPGVTVEKREGTYKKLSEPISIVDLPGIYSLSPYTSEEVISRNYILEEKPECIINVIDATNLERNLYLTTQLLEMDVPIVVALNMSDLVLKNNEQIDVAALSKKLGVPVVEISALKQTGLKELMEVAYQESLKERKATTVISRPEIVKLLETLKKDYEGQEVSDPLFHAVKLIELDEIEVKEHKDLAPIVTKSKEGFNDEIFGSDYEAIIADDRYKYISEHLKDTKSYVGPVIDGQEEKEKLTISDKIDKVLTNRWAGIPIFIVILLVIFHLTFSTNFLFLKDAIGTSSDTFEPTCAGTTWEGLIVSEDGVASPGVFLQTCLTGLTDWFTDVVRGWMEGQKEWAVGFVCDGVLAGIFSVLSFLPQILLLFFFFAILEDTGYMARIAFILDRIFRKFGLSGRALLPMIMGFGCSVPASINTRTLASDNEKTATIRVIPFFSCGAKLPVLTAVGGQIAAMAGMSNPDLVTFAAYMLGVVVAIISVIAMRNTTMRGEVPPFIMELPAYHLPQFKALMIHLWDKLKHFVKKAFTVILASNILIWFMSHANLTWNHFLGDDAIDQSVLATIGKLFQPIFTPLGFGSQLTGSYAWVFVVAIVAGLIAKENVVSLLAILACTIVGGEDSGEYEGMEAIRIMTESTGITIPALLSFISFNMLTIPCFAATATAKSELPKGKFKGTIAFWLGTSYGVSMVIYLIGTYWWTTFIFVAIAALAIVGIYFFNKYRDNKAIKQ